MSLEDKLKQGIRRTGLRCNGVSHEDSRVIIKLEAHSSDPRVKKINTILRTLGLVKVNCVYGRWECRVVREYEEQDPDD